MKTYTLRYKGESFQITGEEADKIDQQQNRRRLSGAELEAIIQMQAGAIAIRDASTALERYMRERKKTNRIKPCLTQIENAVRDMADHIATRQYISMYNNIQGATMTVSSLPTSQCTNMRCEDLNAIIRQATRMCAIDCTMTREQSKQCPLRRALETVPGMKDTARSQLDLGGCPYMMIEVGG